MQAQHVFKSVMIYQISITYLLINIQLYCHFDRDKTTNEYEINIVHLIYKRYACYIYQYSIDIFTKNISLSIYNISVSLP